MTASFETGLVVVEGTADATALRARLQAKTKKDVRVVSDGAEEDGEAATGGGGAYASQATPILLEMELHCRSCADRVERRVMEIPGASASRRVHMRGISFRTCLLAAICISLIWNVRHVIAGVDAVTTDVQARLVKFTGTADASAVATSLEVRMRKPVRVVSDPTRPEPDVVPGYDHEWRKAAASRAAAQQMQEMYGPAATTHVAPQEASSATDESSCSLSSLFSSAPPALRRLRACQPPSPPASTSSSSYGAPPPQAGYWYAEPPGGAYGGQYWAGPAPPSGGFYMHQGGESFGQQWPAYPPPTPEPDCYYPYGGQQDLNPGGSCSIQ